MSYSFTASGSADEIRSTFDAEIKKAADYGMIEGEQLDIKLARDLAVNTAERHGRTSVSCMGHWSGGTFGRFSLRCSAAPPPDPKT